MSRMKSRWASSLGVVAGLASLMARRISGEGSVRSSLPEKQGKAKYRVRRRAFALARP